MREPRASARLFVAIDLNEAARRAATTAAAELAGLIVEAGRGDRITWVRSRNLHLTLRFLGPVDRGAAAALATAFRPPIGVPDFDLELAAAGMFPARGAPRVVWLGVRDPRKRLGDLLAAVDRRVGRAGPAVGRGRFTAHLTLGRVRRATGEGRVIRGALDQIHVESVRWRVDRVTLYESRLSSTGSTYLPAARAPMGGAAGRPAGTPERAG